MSGEYRDAITTVGDVHGDAVREWAAIATDDDTLANLAASAHELARYLLGLVADIVAGNYVPAEHVAGDLAHWETNGIGGELLAVADRHAVNV